MLLDAVAALRAAEGWHAALFVEPPGAIDGLAALTGIEDARPQAGGSVGWRVLGALEALSEDGYAPVAVVSSDVPMLSAAHLDAAREALREGDVVFGPSVDGGSYLVAMWQPDAELFDDAAVEWGSPRALAGSEAIARARGTRFSRISMERAVATGDDLGWLRGRIAALEANGERVPPHTARALQAIEEPASELDASR